MPAYLSTSEKAMERRIILDVPGERLDANPADAMKAFLDLKARWMVPMHYGTFRLSHEPVDEPLQLLDQEAKAAGIKDRVVVLEEGVTRFF